MQPSTVEKALHNWRPWQESLLKARSKFHFTPLLNREQLQKWRWDNEDELWNYGESAIKDIGLPHSSIYYWLACFYSDHLKSDDTIDYDAIKDVFITSLNGIREKSYPLIYEYRLVVSASTKEELLATKIIPTEDTILPLPEELEELIESIKGRLPKYGEIEKEIKKGKLQYEDVSRRLYERGDMQAEWYSIKREHGKNPIALKKHRRILINRINVTTRRLWGKAGFPVPKRKRGNWCKELFN